MIRTYAAVIGMVLGLATTSVRAGDALVAFGLEHAPLGDAIVTVGKSEVVVTGIGETGSDGVAITLGDAAGWSGAIDFGPAGALPGGMSLGVVTTFVSGGVPGGAGIAIVETDGGLASVRLDDVSCACAVTVELRLDGTIVDSAALGGPPYGAIASGALGTGGGAPLSLRTERTTNGDGAAERVFVLTNPEPTAITLVGSVPMTADEIRVRVDGVAPAVTARHRVEVTAAGLDELVLSDEALVQFGHDHRVSGALEMLGTLDGDGQPDVLVTNVTSGFDDNELRIGPPVDSVTPAGAIDLRLAFPMPEPPLFSFERSTHARFADGTDGELGTSAFALGACGCAYAFYVFDPGSAGAVTKIATAHLDGAVVDRAEPPGDAMWFTSAVDARPDAWSVELDPDAAPGTLAYREIWRWDEPTPATLFEGSGRVLVDAIRVTVTADEGPRNPPASLGETRIRPASLFDVASFIIDDVSVRPFAPPCPSDLSGDGRVGMVDLLVLLASWGPCPGCPADLDGDGAVEGDDLMDLLVAWGDCERSRP